MVLKRIVWGLIGSLSVVSLQLNAESLFIYEGQPYQKNDLSPSAQQAVYDAEKAYHEGVLRIIENEIQTKYFEAQAKKSGKKLSVIEAEQAPKITENEAKKWYEENKSRLGDRPFDIIKSDILNYLQGRKSEENKTKLVEQLKNSGKLTVSLPEPKTPVFSISSEGFPAKGPATAKLTIVEFADYQCPHCVEASKVLKKISDKYKDKVKFVFLDFPLRTTGLSHILAEGGVCADAQKKFWEYHQLAFEKTFNPGDNAPEAVAAELKLDMKSFKTCMADPKTKEKISKSRAEGERIGVQGTPSIYLNGQKQDGYDQAQLEKNIKLVLSSQ